jgi:hypothetical protein
MTERAGRARRVTAAPVVWGSLALFAVLFALLAHQLAGSAPGAAERRHVVLRKVIAKRVVRTLVPAEATTGAAPPVGGASVEVETPEAEPIAPEPEPLVTSSS